MANTGSSNITMRAWAIGAYGAAPQIIELPLPRPGPGDVLIRMHGAEVGAWDERVRKGEWRMERPFPLVLGLGGAGTVTSVGKDVTVFNEDDPVYAYNYPLYDNGAWAEYMLVPETYAAPPPPVLDLARAGAVPVAAMTVHEALVDVLDVRKDEVVMITAAHSDIGHLAIQLAKHMEAKVVAITNHPNVEFVTALGADTIFDRIQRDLIKGIHTVYPKGVNKALNCLDDPVADELIWAMCGGGHLLDLTGAISARRPDVRVDVGHVARGDGARLNLISDLIDGGILRVEIEPINIIPFEQAPKALDRALTGQVPGKIALKIR
jgi:NADPH:quinone reductase-like Zn-dependent oxidoreductase